MRSIAFDDSFHDVYENVGTIWRAIWPVPVMAQAAFIEAGAMPVLSDRSLAFREDSFDATTRIRRGRLYTPAERPGHQPWALPHPVYGALGSMQKNPNGCVWRDLRIFDQYQQGSNIPGRHLIIGAAESAWVLLAAERISTGEQLLTLKTRRAFGILPEVNASCVPEIGRHGVVETVSKLVDAAYRESPESVVDRARDAAQICLATWAASKWSDPKLLAHDLGFLIKHILAQGRGERQSAAVDAANLVRVLHARGKWNEKKKRGLRPVLEDDSELPCGQ
jgi:hypothetical protein